MDSIHRGRPFHAMHSSNHGRRIHHAAAAAANAASADCRPRRRTRIAIQVPSQPSHTPCAPSISFHRHVCCHLHHERVHVVRGGGGRWGRRCAGARRREGHCGWTPGPGTPPTTPPSHTRQARRHARAAPPWTPETTARIPSPLLHRRRCREVAGDDFDSTAKRHLQAGQSGRTAPRD